MELVTSETDDRYISVFEGFTLVGLEENMLEGMPYYMHSLMNMLSSK